MNKLLLAYLRNAVRAKLSRSPWFEPMVATLYVTPFCNLRCTYCEDFGAQRNDDYRGQLLAGEQQKRIFEMLAEVSDVLYVTGGEPTMRSDLADLLHHARVCGFGYLAMNTNALTLRDHEAVLDELDMLVVSLDSLEHGRFDSVLVQNRAQIRTLIDNVRWAARLQRERRFTLSITSVVTPGRVDEARRVRDFCFEIGAQFAAQHLSIGRLPSAELDSDPEFHAFMEELIADKRRGLPISGSELYLRRTRTMEPYACTPTVAPHVDWRGRLAYPCRELPHHIQVDMLAAGSYAAAFAEAKRRYGPPPSDCSRCGERCYVELSMLVRKPTALAREALGYLRARAT